MIAIATFIIILSLLVLIHELGHYLAARWTKIKVDEFGLGYPPRAITLFKRGRTIFSLNYIPFGGFVKMDGEDGPDLEHAVEVNDDKEGPFYAKSAWRRLVVILAGVIANFLFGIVAFAIVFSFIGIPEPLDRARIAQTMPDSPAAQAQLPSGVEIIALRDGETLYQVRSNQDVLDAINQVRGKTVTIVTTGPCTLDSCQESAQEFSVYVRSLEETPQGQGALGVVFEVSLLRHYPWYEMPIRGVWVGIQQAFFFGLLIVSSLAQVAVEVVTEFQVPSEVAGPVGIVDEAHRSGVLQEGWVMLLNFAGLLSVNLGVMNLLPIPALDGGRALFILFEKLIGKKHIQRVESYAHYGGFVILISLIVLVTIRDVWRIIER